MGWSASSAREGACSVLVRAHPRGPTVRWSPNVDHGLSDASFPLRQLALRCVNPDGDGVVRVRERVIEQGAAERRIGYGMRTVSVEPNDNVCPCVGFLPDKGEVFRTLINHAHALEMARFILAEHAILSGALRARDLPVGD